MQFDFEFDFEHWRKLAEEQPAQYFAERKALIERFIASAPASMAPDLIQLQGLIDHSRAEAGTPQIAVQQMMGMLGDYLAALAGQMKELKQHSLALAATQARGD